MLLSKPKGALVNVDSKVLIHLLVENALPVKLSILKLAKVSEPAIVSNQDTVLLAGLKWAAACRGIEQIILPRSGIKVTIMEETLSDGPVPHIILKFTDVFIQVIVGAKIRTFLITRAILDKLADSMLLTFRFFLLLFFARVNLLLTLGQLPHLSVEKVSVLIFDDVENVQFCCV